MMKSDYPMIVDYLRKQKFPNDAISNAIVSHIWTQDRLLSKNIAKSARIEYIVDSSECLINKVDAILLARDDAENHFDDAKIFLERGMPIYIDKPLALSKLKALQILDTARYDSQVFSCSALKYSKSMKVYKEELDSIGKIISITGRAPKSWDKYGIHSIESVLGVIDKKTQFQFQSCERNQSEVMVSVRSDRDEMIKIITTGKPDTPIELDIQGEQGSIKKVFNDPFFSFKKTLEHFIYTVKSKRPAITRKEMLQRVEFVEYGSAI